MYCALVEDCSVGQERLDKPLRDRVSDRAAVRSDRGNLAAMASAWIAYLIWDGLPCPSLLWILKGGGDASWTHPSPPLWSRNNSNQRAMSSSKAEEPVNEQAVANKFAAMRSELNQIYSKITELEMDVSEHSLVINAIQPLDPSRRCFRMIGGVLVERTIKEVLPAVQRNKEGIEEVITRLNEALERKKKEITEFEAKYKIRIRKNEGEEKDDGARKEGTAQGVLVGLAGGSE
ncbi:hypothetical protein ACLB2K_035081 [Fragaria x ananassa]